MSSDPTIPLSFSADASTVPLVVPPRDACRMLSIGESHLYELLRAGELRSYRDGRCRRITIESIRNYVARQLAAARAESIGAEAALGAAEQGAAA